MTHYLGGMMFGRGMIGKVVLAAGVALPLVAAGCSSGSSAPTTTAAASSTPITIAYISSITGEGASQDGSSPAGFYARIDMQNAQGGVNGHKLVPLVIDDQTNPALIATAVQSAI